MKYNDGTMRSAQQILVDNYARNSQQKCAFLARTHMIRMTEPYAMCGSSSSYPLLSYSFSSMSTCTSITPAAYHRSLSFYSFIHLYLILTFSHHVHEPYRIASYHVVWCRVKTLQRDLEDMKTKGSQSQGVTMSALTNELATARQVTTAHTHTHTHIYIDG